MTTSSTLQPIPLLDVPRGNESIRDEVLQLWTEAFDKGMFVGGPFVKQLEDDIAAICGTKHAIACASGSDALLLALMAGGIEPGDEVIVPAFTFFATVSAVWRLGATPVFADIDPVSFNLCPTAVRKVITQRTRAIIPVHLFGLSADMEQYRAIASEHDLWLIEDAAQSIGARFDDQPVGGIGDIGCFSFYPSKNLGGFGDGGIMTTNDDATAQSLRVFANHGMESAYNHVAVGINSRLDSLQAAGLLVKARGLEQIAQKRRENAQRYFELFAAAGLTDTLQLPTEVDRTHHVWNQFTIRIPDGRRDEIKSGLLERNIGAAVYYPIPLHQQKCFQALGYGPGSLPVTEQACEQVLSLPIFPGLRPEEQQRVVEAIAATWNQSSGQVRAAG